MFTAAVGLQLHMVEGHGSGAKPYDCHLCPWKFFFRSELEHHVVDHETGKIRLNHQSLGSAAHSMRNANDDPEEDQASDAVSEDKRSSSPADEAEDDHRGTKTPLPTAAAAVDDEEEYIEVEKLAETVGVDAAKSEAISDSSDDEAATAPLEAAHSDSSDN